MAATLERTVSEEAKALLGEYRSADVIDAVAQATGAKATIPKATVIAIATEADLLPTASVSTTAASTATLTQVVKATPTTKDVCDDLCA